MALTNAEHNTDTPVLLEDVTRTASENSEDYTSKGRRGLILFVDVDSFSGAAPTLDVKIQAKSPNGDYVDVPSAAMTQITTAGSYMFTLYPGHTNSAGVSHNAPLPRVFRVVTTMGGTITNWNGSVSAHLIP